MFEVMLGGGRNKTGGASMFIGEVPSAEFITGTALAAAIGLTAGVPQNSDAGWLKFADTVDGKTKYISKKPMRHTVSWDALNARGAVFGTTTVVINGDTYKVRLLKGIIADTLVGTSSGYDLPSSHGCEWNRLLYHVSAKPFGHASNTLQSEGITEGDWASYSEVDLVTHYTHGRGSYNWCQETGTDPTTRVYRGYAGVSHTNQTTSSNASVNRGWRPVLELVE